MPLTVRRDAQCSSADYDVADVVRRALEAEIAMHADAIIDLKGRINTIAPISKLPPEMLAEVFLHVVANYHCEPGRLVHNAAMFSYKWITITHVCRAWRDIALNTPRLWSYLVLASPEMTEMVLARSKMAPLCVTATILSASDWRFKLLETIMQNSRRIKDVYVVGSARVLRSLVAKWSGPADLLESIFLTESRVYDPMAIFPSGHLTSDVLPKLFASHTPKLRHLEIDRTVITWDNPLLCSSLTTLRISCRRENLQRNGTFPQFLAALENMPLLEHIHLIEAIPRVPEDTTSLPPATRSPVALPHLRNLEVISDIFDCANFLNHVTFPSNARLHVNGRTERGEQDLIRVFGEHLARAPPLLSAVFSPVYSAQVFVKGWRTVVAADAECGPELDADPYGPYGDCEAVRPPAPDAALYLDVFPHSRTTQPLVRDAAFLARLERLEILSASVAWDWPALFARTHALRVLVLGAGRPDVTFFRALSPALGGADAVMPAPALEEVEMKRARFECKHGRGEGLGFLEELPDWLMLRCNYGMPVRVLRLSQCVNLEADVVEKVREIVPDVVWDERVDNECDVDEDDLEEEEWGADFYEGEHDLLFPMFPDDDDDLLPYWIPFG